VKIMNRRYILVTAAKNEGGNLSNLIQSVAEQTIKPMLWVIADDGSSDNTPEIIKEAKGKYEWIQSLRLNSEVTVRDIGLHLSSVMMKVTEFAIGYCGRNEIKYEYIGNIDGDIIIEPKFFEKLIIEFEKDDKIGIAGSGTQYIKGDNIIQPEGGEEEPSGGDMLIRRGCFEDCGGLKSSASPWDSVLKAKARLRGWKTRRFEEITATETRDPMSTESRWMGYLNHGKGAYYLNTNPIHVIVKGIIYSFKKPYYIGIPYLLGYFADFVQRKDQIDDNEIKEYYWNKYKELFRKLIKMRL